MDQEISTIRGIVRNVVAEQADVEVEQGGCGRCHEEGGCGGQHLTQMFCSGPRHYQVENSVGAQVGDRVNIAIVPGSVRQTANLAYGFPLLGALGGAMLGALVAGDHGAMLGCLAGLVMAFIVVALRSRRPSGKLAERPYIVSRS